MSRWRLHRGPSNQELTTRLERSNRDRDEWRQRAGKLAAERDQLAAEIRLLEQAEEPAPGDGCKKVRLHSRFEAEAFLLKVALALRENPGEYHAYTCETCPRHPLIGKFWHIAHRIPGWKRALKGRCPVSDRFWWHCVFGCGAGGGEATAADRDEAKATHEQFCSRNPSPPPR